MEEIINEIKTDIELIKKQNSSLGVKYEELLEAIISARVDDKYKQKALIRLRASTQKFLSHYISEDELKIINNFLDKALGDLKTKNDGLIISNKKPSLFKRVVDGIINHFPFQRKKIKIMDSDKEVLDCELPPVSVLESIFNKHYSSYRGGFPLSDYVLANQSISAIPFILTDSVKERRDLQIDVINPYNGKKEDTYRENDTVCICPSISPRAMEKIQIITKKTNENTVFLPYATDKVVFSNQPIETLEPLDIRGISGQYFYDKDNNRILRKIKIRPWDVCLSDEKYYSQYSELYTEVNLIPFEKHTYNGKVMWVATQPVVSGIPHTLSNQPIAINYLNGSFLEEVKELSDACKEKKIFGDNIDPVMGRSTEERQKITLPPGNVVSGNGENNGKSPKNGTPAEVFDNEMLL